MNYSRAVRWLKIGLPLLALGLLSAVFLLPRDTGFDGGLIYSTADLLKLGEGLTVSNPRFTGTTEKGEPFVVSAVAAIPDGPDPTLVTLDAPRAEIDQSGRSITLTSAAGSLRPKDNTLALTGGVTLVTSDGYRVTTDRIEANIKDGAMRAPGPVRAVGPQGAIEAGSFRAERAPKTKPDAGSLTDGQPAEPPAATGALSVGDRIWFENRVKVTYAPAPRRTGETDGGASGAAGRGKE
ncbi:MAG: lipopolysaccharide export system protein LptC [Paracoccaceae bacterium]|jgi:lipopolysaccharide export system protein LptC